MQSLNKIQLKLLVLIISPVIIIKNRFSQILFILLAISLVVWSNELFAQNQANCPTLNITPSIGSNSIVTTVPRVTNFRFQCK
jgi:hypothetical protein